MGNFITKWVLFLETWYNITNAELELLESVDVKFLRSLLKAPRSTPKEMFFLELGCVPIRELIIKRRIMFLHYIINQSENSMIYKFFKTQLKTKRTKDWVSSVLKDLEDLKIEKTIEEIKNTKKITLKRMINKAITEKAFNRLIGIKENHSKVRHLEYAEFKMQNYLKPSKIKIKQCEIQTIFQMRSRVTNVKLNFRGKFENFECRACNKEEESQKHVYECEKITNRDKNNNNTYENIFKENVRKQVEVARYFKEKMKNLIKLG